MRSILLSILLAACSTSSATAPAAPAPRNLVCERVAILSPKSVCQPEMSGVGEGNTHTARVTVTSDKGDSTLACGLNVGQLSMACGGLEVAQPAPKAEPVAAPAPVATKPAKR